MKKRMSKKNKKILLTLIIITLIIIVPNAIYNYKNRVQRRMAKYVYSQLEEAERKIHTVDDIVMSDFTDFDWDYVVIYYW